MTLPICDCLRTMDEWGRDAHHVSMVFELGPHRPRIHKSASIAPGTVLIGRVNICAGASIGANCVLRGDTESVVVGAGANIEDGVIIHADPGYSAIIGKEAMIGRRAIVHGCTVRDTGIIGAGATAMNGAVVESLAMLGAGSMLTTRKCIPSGQLWAGSPAQFVRDLKSDGIAYIE